MGICVSKCINPSSSIPTTCDLPFERGKAFPTFNTEEEFLESLEPHEQAMKSVMLKWFRIMKKGSFIEYATYNSQEFRQMMKKGVPSRFRWQAWRAVTRSHINFKAGEYSRLASIPNSKSEDRFARDVGRTFTSGEGADFVMDPVGLSQLHRILRAWENHNPTVEYGQGMIDVVTLLLIVAHRHHPRSHLALTKRPCPEDVAMSNVPLAHHKQQVNTADGGDNANNVQNNSNNVNKLNKTVQVEINPEPVSAPASILGRLKNKNKTHSEITSESNTDFPLLSLINSKVTTSSPNLKQNSTADKEQLNESSVIIPPASPQMPYPYNAYTTNSTTVNNDNDNTFKQQQQPVKMIRFDTITSSINPAQLSQTSPLPPLTQDNVDEFSTQSKIDNNNNNNNSNNNRSNENNNKSNIRKTRAALVSSPAPPTTPAPKDSDSQVKNERNSKLSVKPSSSRAVTNSLLPNGDMKSRNHTVEHLHRLRLVTQGQMVKVLNSDKCQDDNDDENKTIKFADEAATQLGNDLCTGDQTSRLLTKAVAPLPPAVTKPVDSSQIPPSNVNIDPNCTNNNNVVGLVSQMTFSSPLIPFLKEGHSVANLSANRLSTSSSVDHLANQSSLNVTFTSPVITNHLYAPPPRRSANLKVEISQEHTQGKHSTANSPTDIANPLDNQTKIFSTTGSDQLGEEKDSALQQNGNFHSSLNQISSSVGQGKTRGDQLTFTYSSCPIHPHGNHLSNSRNMNMSNNILNSNNMHPLSYTQHLPHCHLHNSNNNNNVNNLNNISYLHSNLNSTSAISSTGGAGFPYLPNNRIPLNYNDNLNNQNDNSVPHAPPPSSASLSPVAMSLCDISPSPNLSPACSPSCPYFLLDNPLPPLFKNIHSQNSAVDTTAPLHTTSISIPGAITCEPPGEVEHDSHVANITVIDRCPDPLIRASTGDKALQMKLLPLNNIVNSVRELSDLRLKSVLIAPLVRRALMETLRSCTHCKQFKLKRQSEQKKKEKIKKKKAKQKQQHQQQSAKFFGGNSAQDANINLPIDARGGAATLSRSKQYDISATSTQEHILSNQHQNKKRKMRKRHSQNCIFRNKSAKDKILLETNNNNTHTGNGSSPSHNSRRHLTGQDKTPHESKRMLYGSASTRNLSRSPSPSPHFAVSPHSAVSPQLRNSSGSHLRADSLRQSTSPVFKDPLPATTSQTFNEQPIQHQAQLVLKNNNLMTNPNFISSVVNNSIPNFHLQDNQNSFSSNKRSEKSNKGLIGLNSSRRLLNSTFASNETQFASAKPSSTFSATHQNLIVNIGKTAQPHQQSNVNQSFHTSSANAGMNHMGPSLLPLPITSSSVLNVSNHLSVGHSRKSRASLYLQTLQNKHRQMQLLRMYYQHNLHNSYNTSHHPHNTHATNNVCSFHRHLNSFSSPLQSNSHIPITNSTPNATKRTLQSSSSSTHGLNAAASSTLPVVFVSPANVTRLFQTPTKAKIPSLGFDVSAATYNPDNHTANAALSPALSPHLSPTPLLSDASPPKRMITYPPIEERSSDPVFVSSRTMQNANAIYHGSSSVGSNSQQRRGQLPKATTTNNRKLQIKSAIRGRTGGDEAVLNNNSYPYVHADSCLSSTISHDSLHAEVLGGGRLSNNGSYRHLYDLAANSAVCVSCGAVAGSNPMSCVSCSAANASLVTNMASLPSYLRNEVAYALKWHLGRGNTLLAPAMSEYSVSSEFGHSNAILNSLTMNSSNNNHIGNPLVLLNNNHNATTAATTAATNFDAFGKKDVCSCVCSCHLIPNDKENISVSFPGPNIVQNDLDRLSLPQLNNTVSEVADSLLLRAATDTHATDVYVGDASLHATRTLGNASPRTAILADLQDVENQVVDPLITLNLCQQEEELFELEEEVFWVFLMLMEAGDYLVCSIFKAQRRNILNYIFERSLAQFLPDVYSHLLSVEGMDIISHAFTEHWFIPLFLRSFPISTVVRIWDYLLADGRQFTSLVEIGLCLVSLRKESVLSKTTLEGLIKTLKRFYPRLVLHPPSLLSLQSAARSLPLSLLPPNESVATMSVTHSASSPDQLINSATDNNNNSVSNNDTNNNLVFTSSSSSIPHPLVTNSSALSLNLHASTNNSQFAHQPSRKHGISSIDISLVTGMMPSRNGMPASNSQTPLAIAGGDSSLILSKRLLRTAYSSSNRDSGGLLVKNNLNCKSTLNNKTKHATLRSVKYKSNLIMPTSSSSNGQRTITFDDSSSSDGTCNDDIDYADASDLSVGSSLYEQEFAFLDNGDLLVLSLSSRDYDTEHQKSIVNASISSISSSSSLHRRHSSKFVKEIDLEDEYSCSCCSSYSDDELEFLSSSDPHNELPAEINTHRTLVEVARKCNDPVVTNPLIPIGSHLNSAPNSAPNSGNTTNSPSPSAVAAVRDVFLSDFILLDSDVILDDSYLKKYQANQEIHDASVSPIPSRLLIPPFCSFSPGTSTSSPSEETILQSVAEGKLRDKSSGSVVRKLTTESSLPLLIDVSVASSSSLDLKDDIDDDLKSSSEISSYAMEKGRHHQKNKRGDSNRNHEGNGALTTDGQENQISVFPTSNFWLKKIFNWISYGFNMNNSSDSNNENNNNNSVTDMSSSHQQRSSMIGSPAFGASEGELSMLLLGLNSAAHKMRNQQQQQHLANTFPKQTHEESSNFSSNVYSHKKSVSNAFKNNRNLASFNLLSSQQLVLNNNNNNSNNNYHTDDHNCVDSLHHIDEYFTARILAVQAVHPHEDIVSYQISPPKSAPDTTNNNQKQPFRRSTTQNLIQSNCHKNLESDHSISDRERRFSRQVDGYSMCSSSSQSSDVVTDSSSESSVCLRCPRKRLMQRFSHRWLERVAGEKLGEVIVQLAERKFRLSDERMKSFEVDYRRNNKS